VARHDPAIRKASTAKIDVAVLAWLTHSDPNQEPVRLSHLDPMANFPVDLGGSIIAPRTAGISCNRGVQAGQDEPPGGVASRPSLTLRSNDEVAPIPAVRWVAIEPPESTHCRSLRLALLPAFDTPFSGLARHQPERFRRVVRNHLMDASERVLQLLCGDARVNRRCSDPTTLPESHT
jgi:hypothetical protein